MPKFIVKCLAVNGKNNKIYRNGDEVTDKHFHAGIAAKYLASGKIVLAEGETMPESTEETIISVSLHNEDENLDEKSKKAGEITDPEDEICKPFDEVTKEDMIKRLMNKNESFNPSMKPKKLYELYEKTFEKKEKK